MDFDLCVILQIFFLMNTYVYYAKGICSKVTTCPSNKQKWTERGKEFNCTGDSSYHCIFVVESVDRGLCELCYVNFTIQKEYSGCPAIEWDRDNNAYFPTDNIACSVNLTGCPPKNAVYFSDEVYRFPLCTGHNGSTITDMSNDSTVTSSPNEKSNGNVNIGLVIVVSIIGLILISVTIFVMFYRIRKGRHKRDEQKKEEEALLLLESASFMEVLSATFRNRCWILRCKVSCENALCKWYRMKEQDGYSEVNDGEIRIREEQEYRILEVPQITGLDGTYKCELPNGKSVEINLDFNQNASFIENLRATFRNKCWILRCKISFENAHCKWYRMKEQEGYSEVNDGDGEIRILEKQEYRILEVPQITGLDGTYKCELPNGKSVEINLDFNQTDITMKKVGETCTFIRMLDETHKQCEWYKGDDRIESDEHFRIDNENNQSRLIIMNVQNIHSQSSFHSKIGEEIQFHGIYVEESSDMIEETDQKTYGNSSENETVVDGTLSRLPDDGQPTIVQRPSTSFDDGQPTIVQRPSTSFDTCTSSASEVRKVVDHSVILSKPLDQLFHRDSWEELAGLIVSVAEHLQVISTIHFGEEILRKMNDTRRYSTRICKEAIKDVHSLLKSVTRPFEDIPNPSDFARRRDFLQTPFKSIEFFRGSVKLYKEHSEKVHGDLRKAKKNLEEKIESIENEPKCNKLHEDDIGDVIERLQSIVMYFDSICGILAEMEDEVCRLDIIFESVARDGQDIPIKVTLNTVRDRFHSFDNVIEDTMRRFIEVNSCLDEVYKRYRKIIDQSLNDGDDNGSAENNRDVCMAQSTKTLFKY